MPFSYPAFKAPASCPRRDNALKTIQYAKILPYKGDKTWKQWGYGACRRGGSDQQIAE
jgi:hypothetical protein